MSIHKVIAFAILAGMVIYLASCGNTQASSNTSSGAVDLAVGEEVFNKYCILCHGEDGKKEFNGAKDITVSELTLEERVTLITEGRNLMTPFKGILSEEEIRSVAAYTQTLDQ